MQNCFVENCEDQVVAKGMCNKHYLRRKRVGTVEDNGRSHASLSTRFFRKVDRTATCWIWTGNTSRNGYGSIQSGGKEAPPYRRIAFHTKCTKDKYQRVALSCTRVTIHLV